MKNEKPVSWIQAIKEVSEMVTTALLILCIPCALFLLISSRTEVAGLRSFVVLTGSMEPTIPVGSIVVTQIKDLYLPGDIVTYTHEDKKVTHRIIGTNQNGYVTKGDANNTNDSFPVFKKDIVGRDILLIPSIGSIIKYLRTPIGFGSLIVIPGIIVICSELLIVKREIEKEVEKKMMRRLTTV